MDLAIEGGFADPVLDAQGAFRAIMDALARPGRRQALPPGAAPPTPLTPELGSVALTLCDHDSPIWLDAALAADAAVGGWLRFQCGAPLTSDPTAAQFALVSDSALLPPLERFTQGSDEYPDRSTTIVLAPGATLHRLTLRGPGIKGELVTELPVPSGDFIAQWRANRARFPRGVDLLLVGDGAVIGLPRSTRISEA